MSSSTICADQHKLFSSHQLFSSKIINNHKPFKDLEIPPRKLIKEEIVEINSPPLDHHMSPYQKYLPYNHGRDDGAGDDDADDDDDDLDPYSSDHFRMYEFKVRRCTRSRSHDWTDCPFAHPGEKARRRDPRRFHYSGAVCPEFRRGGCSRGDNCEFAHGVFECWLHPSRYRTEACKDGKNCKRKVCFFAHSPRELRILPEISSCGSRKYDKATMLGCGGGNCCCLLCHSVASSPNSTLLGLSPPLSPSMSPPLSPVKHRWFSRYGDRFSKLGSGVVSYKDMLTELMSSLEAMNVAEQHQALVSGGGGGGAAWNIDGCFNGGDDQQQFILSPSTPSPSSGSGNFFRGKVFIDNNCKINNISTNNNSPDPDLGWVNELLM